MKTQDMLIPLADSLGMYLKYYPKDARGCHVGGQCRFSLEGESKLMFTLRVVDSFFDDKTSRMVLLLRVTNHLYVLAGHNTVLEEVVIRMVDISKVNLPHLKEGEVFSSMSDYSLVLSSWKDAILATYHLKRAALSWEKSVEPNCMVL